MSKLRIFVLKHTEFYSFATGIIIGGFCVELMSNTEMNNYHWLAVVSALPMGFFLFHLSQISRRFNKSLTFYVWNKTKPKNSESIEEYTWEIMSKEKTKLFFKVVQINTSFIFYFVFSLLLMISFFVFFVLGRLQNQSDDYQQEKALNQKSQTDSLKIEQLTKNQETLLLKIDSLSLNLSTKVPEPKMDTLKPQESSPKPKNQTKLPADLTPRKDSSKHDSLPRRNAKLSGVVEQDFIITMQPKTLHPRRIGRFVHSPSSEKKKQNTDR